ncbi:hypothetical protein BU16DRAFT_543400 [Lophium mytilinum]|uniref:Uncharacterized protein n=1 Tax=Lophium mytilinum TaxID=390894 RepID=A0A6A6QHM9_9PEZI|nr:hypothetical protein BU16DRAFT_543400 [Lophium mytilinum]
MSMQAKESTNALAIVMDRWGQPAMRTFDTQKILFPPESSSTPARTLGALPTRYERFTHPKYGLNINDPAHACVLARTTLRYNLSSSSFVDFVEDEEMLTHPSSLGSCFRLQGMRWPCVFTLVAPTIHSSVLSTASL